MKNLTLYLHNMQLTYLELRTLVGVRLWAAGERWPLHGRAREAVEAIAAVQVWK